MSKKITLISLYFGASNALFSLKVLSIGPKSVFAISVNVALTIVGNMFYVFKGKDVKVPDFFLITASSIAALMIYVTYYFGFFLSIPSL